MKTDVGNSEYGTRCFSFWGRSFPTPSLTRGSYMYYMRKWKAIKFAVWLGADLNWTPVLPRLMNILTQLAGTSRAVAAANTTHKGKATILRNMHNCLQVLIYHWFHSVLHWNYRIHGSSQIPLHINPIMNVINLIIFGWINSVLCYFLFVSYDWQLRLYLIYKNTLL